MDRAVDERWMARALALARRGLGRTWPNPPVGAVFVRRGRVVGEGYHRRAGRPHAEIEALRAAGGEVHGADLYVTLEPCSHHGRTGPCAEALAGLGLRRVVIAMADPNPRVRGRGVARLRGVGVPVEIGVGDAEARALTAGYRMWVRNARPRVTLKVAASLDGRIATRTGHSQWITGPAARRRGHGLRAERDAILVGAGTVRADDPRLTVRHGSRGQPVRVVLAGAAMDLPVDARVFDGSAPTWVVLPRGGGTRRRSVLERAGVVFVDVRARRGVMNVRDVMAALGARGLTSVLVEGGARVATTLLQAELVDEVAWFVAPVVLGDDARGAVGPLRVAQVTDSLRFRARGVEQLGDDLLVVAEPVRRDRRRVASPKAAR